MFATLWPHLKPYKKSLILGPIFKLLEAIIELLIPIFLARLIDQGVRMNRPDMIRRQGIIMLSAVCIGVAAAVTCQYMSAVCAHGFSSKLRSALFRRCSAFSRPDSSRFGTASLINRMTGDIIQVQTAVAMAIRLLSRAPFLCIGSLICAFFLNPRFALLMLAAVLIAGLALYFIMRATIRVYRGAQTALDQAGSRIRDNLSGIRVIRAFSREAHERESFAAENHLLTRLIVKAGKISALMNPLTTLIFNAVIVTLILRGGHAIDSGSMTQGQLIAFINYLNQIVLAMMVVANLVILFPRAYTSGTRIAEVLQTEPAISSASQDDLGETNPPDARPALLSVQNLSFSYPDSPYPALNKLSFTLDRGECLGIIGATGSGKSTLIRLLQRFYEADSGSISIGGRPIECYSLEELRRHIAVVPQKAALLRGSIRDNLLLGLRPDEKAKACKDNERLIREALNAAQASDFVAEKGGTDSPVAVGGGNFSGGQKQRLTVARALLRTFDILVLDDATSALDYRTDLLLRRSLDRYCRDKALILISQRVHSLRNADKIMVLEDGVCVGLGDHRTLLQTCQVYREICDSQLEGGARDADL